VESIVVADDTEMRHGEFVVVSHFETLALEGSEKLAVLSTNEEESVISVLWWFDGSLLIGGFEETREGIVIEMKEHCGRPS
jgi:hypothetical protein